MKKSISKFLESYQKVARLGVEHTYLDKSLKKFSVNKSDFINDMYFNRKYIEDRLRGHILTDSDDLVCLVGPRGCGKSSIGAFIKDELEKNKLRKTFVVPLNIRKEEAKKYFDTKGKAKKYIRNWVIKYYLKKFQPNFQSGVKNPLFQLYAFILDPEIPPKFKPNDIFIYFQKIVNEAIIEKNRGDYKDYYNWISENYYDYKKFFNRIDKELDVIHLSYALAYVFKYKKQVIWIDNIDALNELEQVRVVNSINKIQTSSIESLIYIIAVREENIFREDQLSDFGTAPFRSVIFWKDPEKHKAEPTHEAYNMPVVTNLEFNEIIRNRLKFTRKIQRKFLNELISEKNVIERNKGRNSHEFIEIDKEIKQFEPLIDDVDYIEIERLSIKLNTSMFNERCHYLANNSLRVLIPLHRDFLAFEILRDFGGENKESETTLFKPSSIGLKDFYIQTELLQFVTAYNDNLMFSLFDIIEVTKERLENCESPIYCFLPNLVITTIWNLCIENTLENREEFYKSPKIQEVVDKLTFLGYKEGEILQSIFDLFYQKNGTSNFITIQTEELVENVDNLTPDMRIRPTYRGKTAVSSVTNSFGYLFALQNRQEGKDIIVYSDSKKTDQDIQKVIPILKLIGESHLKSLLFFRNTKYHNKSNWLEGYYKDYAIPIVKPYCRSTRDGKFQTRRTKYLLTFESILYSLQSYAVFHKAYSSQRQLKQIEENYSNIWLQLDKCDQILVEEFIKL